MRIGAFKKRDQPQLIGTKTKYLCHHQHREMYLFMDDCVINLLVKAGFKWLVVAVTVINCLKSKSFITCKKGTAYPSARIVIFS